MCFFFVSLYVLVVWSKVLYSMAIHIASGLSQSTICSLTTSWSVYPGKLPSIIPDATDQGLRAVNFLSSCLYNSSTQGL